MLRPGHMALGPFHIHEAFGMAFGTAFGMAFGTAFGTAIVAA